MGSFPVPAQHISPLPQHGTQLEPYILDSDDDTDSLL